MSFVPKINPEDFIYLLLLLFLPSQFGKHFWPSFSYVSGVRVDYLSPTIYLTDILILLLLFSVFIKSSGIKILKKIKRFRVFSIHLSLIIIFLIINIVFSQNKPLSIYGALRFLEFLFLGVLTFYKIKKNNISTLISIFSISVIVESLIGIFQYIKQGSIGGILYLLGERSFNGGTPGIANISVDGELILRAYGTFSHPNVLAGFLLLSLTFLLFNFGFKKSIGLTPLVAIILGSIALFLTFSRIPIILFILSLFIFVFLKTKKYTVKKIMISTVILTSLIVSFLFYAPFYLRFFQSSVLEESFILREKLILENIRPIWENLIFGTGLYNYFLANTILKDVFVLQPVHNIFLLVLIQTGLIGLLYFLWFLYKTYLKVLEKKKLFLKLLFFYIIVIGLFDHYFLTLQQGQLMFSFWLGYFWSRDD